MKKRAPRRTPARTRKLTSTPRNTKTTANNQEKDHGLTDICEHKSVALLVLALASRYTVRLLSRETAKRNTDSEIDEKT